VRATYLDALGENSAALESVERSLKLSDCDIPKRCKLRSYLNCVRSLPDQERTKLWLFCKLKAEQDMRRQADKTAGYNNSQAELLMVERVKYCELSVEKFLGKQKTDGNSIAVKDPDRSIYFDEDPAPVLLFYHLFSGRYLNFQVSMTLS
jgi:hypothetical protein